MYDMYDENPEDIMLEEYSNPGLGSEILMAESSNPDAAAACEIAGELRRAGWDASSALREGWARVRGESNPEFEPSLLLTVLVVGGIGTLVYKVAKGKWWWEAIGNRPMRPGIGYGVYQPFRPPESGVQVSVT